jgi:hypothetical protein
VRREDVRGGVVERLIRLGVDEMGWSKDCKERWDGVRIIRVVN